jgi:hypothetical protein
MKYLLPLLLVSFNTFAQKSSPVLSDDKFTVCAITINSNHEKKIFEKQIAKEPKKFNPIVELTDFGSDEDWFAKACASGVKCDQLVVSGHFAGDFFGHDTQKRLPLSDLEKAGCAKSCEGILSKPYEVFLFGCNTLAEKDEDSRTPAQYLQILLNDGFSQSEAEMVVQSRYGNIGDSNRASMQRAFAGEKKKLYGFTSSGPSGETVKKFLDKYFTQTKLSKNLEKMQAVRMLDKVADANTTLAKSMKGTAFTQCDSSVLQDEKSKNICSLIDPKLTIENKLDLTVELLTKDDAFLYLPAINKFFQENSPENFTNEQKERLKLITENKVIRSQLIGLIEKTEGLGLKSSWVDLSFNMGLIGKDEATNYLLPELEKIFSKPLNVSDMNKVCNDGNDYSKYFTINEDNLKNKNITKIDIFAYSCLDIKDPMTIRRVLNFNPKGDKDVLDTISFIADELPASDPLPVYLITHLKSQLNDDEEAGSAMELIFKHYPQDKDVLKKANDILKNGTKDLYLEYVAKQILGKE